MNIRENREKSRRQRNRGAVDKKISLFLTKRRRRYSLSPIQPLYLPSVLPRRVFSQFLIFTAPRTSTVYSRVATRAAAAVRAFVTALSRRCRVLFLFFHFFLSLSLAHSSLLNDADDIAMPFALLLFCT